jgi:Putative S-adenosyl-L-methionine-dependent methyltransferase
MGTAVPGALCNCMTPDDSLTTVTSMQGACASASIISCEHSPLPRQVRWHRSLEEVPAEGPPTVYIANEFFDALPVHQLQRTERGWCGGFCYFSLALTQTAGCPSHA